MFTLSRTNVKLCHINTRAERHGDETVLAADLKIEFKTENTILDKFASGLRTAIYWKKEEGAPGELFDDHKPDVRFPQISAYRWQLECIGWRVEVEHGIDDSTTIILPDCKINNFTFQPEEGGTVKVSFRIQCNPDSEDVGHLLDKLQSEITIMITPPDPDEVQTIGQTDSIFGADVNAEDERHDAIMGAVERSYLQ